MKKVIVVLALTLFAVTSGMAQNRYFTRTGNVSFHSEAAVENIEAVNNQASSILDASNGELAFSIQMRGFEFEKALMQEHFNENYVESDKFPKSTFKGTITNFSTIDVSKNGKHNVNVKGDLTIHGVTKQVSVEGVLEVVNGKIHATSTFPITLSDYEIDIPKAVIENIAKVIDIKVDMELNPYHN